VQILTQLAQLILSNYVYNMGYYKDFAEDGNGLTKALQDGKLFV
jgi:hypothetical protein